MFHNFFYSFITWWIFELLCLCLLCIFIYKLFFLTSVFYVPKNEIDESYGNSMVNFSRNYQIVFHSDYTILHSYQHCMRILISPHTLQHVIFFCCCCFLVTKLRPILCDPMDYSMPGSPGLHYLLEFSQIHVEKSVILSNHLMFCPHSPFAFNLS